MLDRFARGPFCRKRRREVRVSIGVVITQLDRFSVMRDSILFAPFSSERDPESIVEESGAEVGGRLLITAASQGVFKIANRIVDPVAVHGEEREIVIGHITVRRRGERMSPKRLGVPPRRCLYPREPRRAYHSRGANEHPDPLGWRNRAARSAASQAKATQ